MKWAFLFDDDRSPVVLPPPCPELVSEVVYQAPRCTVCKQKPVKPNSTATPAFAHCGDKECKREAHCRRRRLEEKP